MNLKVEELSPVSKKVVVEIDAAEAGQALEDQFRRISKVAVVKGFRPGKVPKDLLKKMYGGDAEAEAVRVLLGRHLEKALEESGVKPIGRPEFEREAIQVGKPFTFSLFCAVLPQFDAVLPEALALERRSTEPPDEAIEAELRTMREKQAQLETVEDRGADTGDIAQIEYTGRVMGEEAPYTGPEPVEADVTLGEPFELPGLPDHLIGARPGDAKAFEVAVPADAENAAIAGKEVLVELTVKAVLRKVIPDLDDDLAVELGFEDAGAARASVYDRLADRARAEEEQRVETLLVDALIELNPIPVPAPLVEEHASRVLETMKSQFTNWGLDESLVERLLDREKDSIRKNSSRAVQRELILDRIAETQERAPSEADIEAELEKLATQLQMPLAKVKGRLERNGGLEEVKNRLRRQQMMDALLEQAYARTPAG